MQLFFEGGRYLLGSPVGIRRPVYLGCVLPIKDLEFEER